MGKQNLATHAAADESVYFTEFAFNFLFLFNDEQSASFLGTCALGALTHEGFTVADWDILSAAISPMDKGIVTTFFTTDEAKTLILSPALDSAGLMHPKLQSLHLSNILATLCACLMLGTIKKFRQERLWIHCEKIRRS